MVVASRDVIHFFLVLSFEPEALSSTAPGTTLRALAALLAILLFSLSFSFSGSFSLSLSIPSPNSLDFRILRSSLVSVFPFPPEDLIFVEETYEALLNNDGRAAGPGTGVPGVGG